MIDLHCHILPGVDDGAATLADSVAMARAAVQDGVKGVVATPHGVQWAYAGDETETKRRVDELRAELALSGVELEIFSGLEVYLTPDTPELLERRRVLTLNDSRYLLVELPLQSVPPYAEQTLFQLQVAGIVPVIAHPERNAQIAEDPSFLARLVDRGMLAQVTAGSLTGVFGSATRAVAERMVADAVVHVIASDGHGTRGREPVLSVARRRAAELIGEEAAEAMVVGVPGDILRDARVRVPEPRPPTRRNWFRFSSKGVWPRTGQANDRF